MQLVSLDFIPTHLLKSCVLMLSFNLTITCLINLSLSEETFPDNFKHATVILSITNTPCLKMTYLSYRPISNLNFISKILERIIHFRLIFYLQSFPSLSRFLTAYRKFHSTETALLYIYTDLLMSINKKRLMKSGHSGHISGRRPGI